MCSIKKGGSDHQPFSFSLELTQLNWTGLYLVSVVYHLCMGRYSNMAITAYALDKKNTTIEDVEKILHQLLDIQFFARLRDHRLNFFPKWLHKQ